MVAGSVPRRQMLLGILVAVGIFVVIAVVVGVDEILSVLGAAAPRDLLAVGLAAVGWLLLWGFSLSVILRSLGVPIGRPRAIGAYWSLVFVNSVTPFAQAGGGALAALIISRSTKADYETSFAAIVGVDTLNILPSVGFLSLGVVFLTVNSQLGGATAGAMWILVGIAATVVALGYLVWRAHDQVNERVAGPLAAVLSGIARFIPRVTPPTRASIRERIDRFVDALETLSHDRRALTTVVVLSTAGWFLLVSALWLALFAVGQPVSFGVVMFAVPASLFAAIIPSPGGAGGIDAALIVVLTATTGLSTATVTGAVLIYRAGTYLLPILLGSIAMASLQFVGPSKPDTTPDG